MLARNHHQAIFFHLNFFHSGHVLRGSLGGGASGFRGGAASAAGGDEDESTVTALTAAAGTQLGTPWKELVSAVLSLSG